jgi:regulator of sirC expression with transglutaminase-like and TPR domain
MYEYMTIDEAARLAQVEPETIRQWLDQGLTYKQEDDGAIKIHPTGLETFLMQHPEYRPASASNQRSD